MIQDNITVIKKRARTIHKVIKVIFFIGVIIFFVALVAGVFLFLASPERFSAVKGSLNWHISYNLTNGSSFFIDIPFKIMQPLDSSMFSAKYAVLASLISLLIKESLILYGINQVANILKSTVNDITPFIMNNVKSLRKLAYSIIIYSVAADILSSILFSVFVTRIFLLDLSNIHLSGVLTGGLILVIADIFKYGVFLQKEFDTTL
jgi:ABC-type methionine transport system permease subunit